jgi:hypothetical protein
MMHLRHGTIGLVALAIFELSGCGSSLDREEAAVYAAYVDAHFTTVADSPVPLKRHVVRDRTSGFQSVDSWRHKISKLSVAPATDTIDDFLARNDGDYPKASLNEQTRKTIGRYPLNSHIKFRLPHVLISDETIEKIFFKEGGGGWVEFARRYPKNHGFLSFSRVGFSKDRKQALFYLGNEYTGGAGEGYLVLLQNRNGIWKEVTRSSCWIS